MSFSPRAMAAVVSSSLAALDEVVATDTRRTCREESTDAAADLDVGTACDVVAGDGDQTTLRRAPAERATPASEEELCKTAAEAAATLDARGSICCSGGEDAEFAVGAVMPSS